jgi:hypothetical protein
MAVSITSWDVRVVSAMDVTSVIAYIPRWTSIELSDQLNDVGSGKITHDFKDPFFSEFETENGQSLLTGPYALQILRNSSLVFTFFIEDVQVDRLPNAETVTISGRGIASALEWACVLPEGFSGTTRAGATTSTTPNFFDRLFPAYTWSARCATTASLTANYANGFSTAQPGFGAQLQSTTNGSINSAGIDGITDLVHGDTVLVKNQANQAHNGVYYVLQPGSGSTAWVLQRTGECDGSPISNMAVGNTVFVQEGAQNGYKAFSLSSNGGMTNSNQVGTNVIVFSPLTTGTFTALSAFWLLFKEADVGREFSSVPDEFGQVVQESGRGGPEFAVSWPLYLDSVIDANIGQLDSKGQIVQDGGNFSVPAGKTMLEVIKQVADQTGLSWHFSPSGSVSFAVTPFTRNGVVRSIPYGVDRTSGSVAMLFSLPELTNSDTKTSSTDRRTVAWGSDGRGLDRLVSDSKSIYGIRESYFENTSGDAAAIANITGSAMRKIDGGKISQTAKFVEQEGKIAWLDFGVGDKVLVETGIGTFSEQIISALSATVSSSDEHNIEMTLGEVFPDIASNLQTQAGFGSLNASTLASFSGSPPNVSLSAPEPRSAVSSTAGMSNRVTVTWDNPNPGRVSKYEVAVYRQGTTKVPTTVVRRGNIVAATFSSPHALTNGMYVNITSDEGFGGFNIPLISTSSSVVYYANSGPDFTATTSVGIAQVIEFTTVNVDGDKDSATIENLAAPGTTYSYHVTPYNEYGLAGQTSAASTFSSSNEPFTLVASDVRSATYSSGSSGWRISADGTAEFNGGAFSVTSIDIGGFDESSFHVDVQGNMWLGASASVSAPFRVSSAGVLTATVGTFSGNLNGGTIDIGGLDGTPATSFHVDSGGNMWIGASTYAAAPFKISSAGFVTSSNGATFFGSLSSSSDANFADGTGRQSYIQNDGRFQSITGGVVFSEMGQGGITANAVNTNALNSRNQNYVNMLGNYVGFRYNIGFGPCDDTYYAAFYATGNTASGNGFSATATRISDNFQYSWNYLQGVSDRRVKINIEEVSEDWEDKFLNQLKIWQFDKINFADDDDLHAYGKHLGVMADEVKEIFPQWETSYMLRDPDGADANTIRGVDYQSMIPALVWICQRFNARINELEARLGI